jgi:carboxyl-terminal processing protease
MKMFKPFRNLLAGVALAGSTLAFGQTAPAQSELTPEVKKEVLANVTRVITKMAFVPGIDLTKWEEFLTGQQEAIDKATTSTEFAMAVREAINKFGISHMVLFTPDMAKARVERKAVGIGINIQPQEDGLLVTNVFEGSPAAEAGIQPGDLIIEADGKKLGKDSVITGEEGTQVELKIKRSSGKVDGMKLTRRKFSNVRTDTLKFVDADTAILKVNTFDISYDRKKIDELMVEARKSKNLILDLRSNGGGAVINMLHLMGYFVPADEKFGIFLGRSLVNRYVEETKGNPTELKKIADWAEIGWLRASKVNGGMYQGNVAVLINGGTGSASEITALAMKELRGAPVIGTKSAGAVLVSTMTPVTNGYVLQFPMSDYLSVQGVRLEGNGIEPDTEAPTPKFGEPDVAIEKAVALLKRAALRNERNP